LHKLIERRGQQQQTLKACGRLGLASAQGSLLDCNSQVLFLLELLLALLVCQSCLLIPPGLALLHLGRLTLSFLQTVQRAREQRMSAAVSADTETLARCH
jgi:hypothetical protein